MRGPSLRPLAAICLPIAFGVLVLLLALGVRDQVSTPRAVTTAPAPTTAKLSAPQRRVAAALDELQRAYVDGDVRRLCRPGLVFTQAVVAQRAQTPGDSCESEVEDLLAGPGRAHLIVRAVDLRPELAVASVRTASGATVPVDLIRHGRRWLVSFSEGEDPLPRLVQ